MNLLTAIFLVFTVYNFVGFCCIVHCRSIEKRELTPNIHSAFIWIPRAVLALNIGFLGLLIFWWCVGFAARVNEPNGSGLGLWAMTILSLPVWVVTMVCANTLLKDKAQKRALSVLFILVVCMLLGNIVAQLIYNWRFR